MKKDILESLVEFIFKSIFIYPQDLWNNVMYYTDNKHKIMYDCKFNSKIWFTDKYANQVAEHYHKDIKLNTLEELDIVYKFKVEWIIIVSHKKDLIYQYCYSEYPTILDIEKLISKLKRNRKIKRYYNINDCDIKIVYRTDYQKILNLTQ